MSRACPRLRLRISGVSAGQPVGPTHRGYLWQALGVTPQPDYVPLQAADRVRPDERLPVPEEWLPNRPGDIHTVHQPSGDLLGNAGPDQGYGLKLAKRFAGRLQLAQGEHEADAVAGCLAVALKRAAMFGRAPVIYDFELAFRLWGFLEGAPPELVQYRHGFFEEASHHYEAVRAIADTTPTATLQLTPTQVAERLGQWRELLSGRPSPEI